MKGFVTVWVVREHVPGMVQDDVQNHSDPMVVRSGNEATQIFTSAEAGLDVEEILYAVAVVGVARRKLLEDRTDPDGRDAETREIADLGGQSTKRAATESLSRLLPPVAWCVAGIAVPKSRRGAVRCGSPVVI
jgi:hypothetical protein